MGPQHVPAGLPPQAGRRRLLHATHTAAALTALTQQQEGHERGQRRGGQAHRVPERKGEDRQPAPCGDAVQEGCAWAASSLPGTCSPYPSSRPCPCNSPDEQEARGVARVRQRDGRPQEGLASRAHVLQCVCGGGWRAGSLSAASSQPPSFMWSAPAGWAPPPPAWPANAHRQFSQVEVHALPDVPGHRLHARHPQRFADDLSGTRRAGGQGAHTLRARKPARRLAARQRPAALRPHAQPASLAPPCRARPALTCSTYEGRCWAASTAATSPGSRILESSASSEQSSRTWHMSTRA